ncbi:hypothetical protein INR49_002354 [Caranx melampygus]|nr:hypothetical protein INR49_002354 [Caranx melampygus]
MKCAAIPQNLHQEGLVTKGAALNQSTAVTWMTKSKTMTQALISTCEADVSEEEEEPGAVQHHLMPPCASSLGFSGEAEG